jgi:Family of unknown function (DUF6049)
MPPRRRVAVLLLLAIVMAPGAWPTRAAAQEEPAFELELVRQPVWHNLDDDLGLKVRITNLGDTSLDGFNLVVGVLYKTRTRSDLHVLFEEEDFDVADSFAVARRASIPPSGSVTVSIDNPVSELGSVLTPSAEEGVYPLKISLQDAAGTPLASIVSTLLFYPKRPETRLDLVPVLPLNDIPARAPDGSFGPTESGEYPLEVALAGDGWLTGYLNGLQRAVDAGLHLGYAPTPRLLEEVRDLADGFPRLAGDETVRVSQGVLMARRAAGALDDLRELAQNDSVQVVAVPYSAPDLPSIREDIGAVSKQIIVGTTVAEEVLGIKKAGNWLLPTAGRVDEATIEELSETGVDHAFMAADSLDVPANPDLGGCPIAEYSFVCPVAVDTALGGPVTGYTFDPIVQEVLSDVVAPGDTRLELQRFFAETAMIREELPGTTERILAVTIPSRWRPTPRAARLILNGLATAPWLKTLTPKEGLERGHRPFAKEVVATIDRPTDQPPDLDLDLVSDADDVVEQFRSIEPPDDLFDRLSRNVLVAHSRSWWPDPTDGLDYATAAVDEVYAELSKIELVGPEQITLTSNKGKFQFVIVNDTEYPATVDVEMSSDNLALPDVGPKTVPPGRRQFEFDVTTQASGIFPLTVQLRTPSGLVINEPKPITVRSTEFNEIALAITLGAVAFVILFYVVRGAKNKRSDDEGPRAGASRV